MKKLITTFFLAVIATAAFAQGGSKPASIDVMSYNIRYGDAKDGTNSWAYRLGATIEMIQDQKPDVIGLQEALSYQMEFIKEYADGYKTVGVGRDDGKKKSEIMGIAYNTKTVKLSSWGTFWLSETPEKPSLGWDGACRRTATWAIVKHKKSGKKIFFVNTHLDHVGAMARQKGVELILEKIEKLNKDNLPVVVLGDMNALQDDPILAPFEEKLRNTRRWAMKTDEGPTYNAWGHSESAQTIDHIYALGFASCPVFQAVRKPYLERKFISDHYPVKATLIF